MGRTVLEVLDSPWGFANLSHFAHKLRTSGQMAIWYCHCVSLPNNQIKTVIQFQDVFKLPAETPVGASLGTC